MDTSASSHMTSDQGTLSTRSNNSFARYIVVGNGDSLPIKSYGMTSLQPLFLRLSLQIFYMFLKLSKIVSVRQFTRDNSVSIEFDPFGFSVKDLVQGTKLLRYDSDGPLYPLLPPMSSNSFSSPSAFAVTSPSLWHHCLGHPGDQVLHSLVSSRLISSVGKISSGVCHSCQLGKQNALSFGLSFSRSTMLFEIIHSDI